MKLLAALTVLLLAAATAAAQDDNAKKIVGKWEVTKSEDIPKGAAVEFLKDGKMLIVAKIEGQDLKLEGTWKVEKNKLTTRVTFGGQTVEDTDTITKLTDDVLEVTDKDKKVTELKRKK